MKIEYQAATASVEAMDVGLTRIALSGPLTVAAIRHFRSTITAEFGRGMLCAVADYRRAVILMSPDELDDVMNEPLRYGRPPCPAAWIVDQGSYATLSRHAAATAQNGIIRRVFLSESLALTWAKRQVTRLTA